MKKYLVSLLYMASMLTASAAEGALFTEFAYSGEDACFSPDRLVQSGDFFNPVISGWASDPSVVRTGKDYWLVTSTFGYFPGVPLYHSTDLVNWEQKGNVLSRKSQLPWLEGLSLGKGGIYAPAISYNPHNGLYYVITTCVTPKGSINFYVTSSDPAGEWSDPVILEDVDGIDPSFFFDDDGRGYIVHKAEEHSPVKWSNNRALAIIEFDAKTGTTVGKPVKFKEEGVGPEERLERNEGPHIYKINGKYYLIAAEGGTGTLHSEVCYKADSPMGPYRRWSRNPMISQRLLKPNRTNPITCTGHADLVTTPEGDWYAAFLGCRPWSNGTEQLGRETFLMPVKWSADSFPYIVQCIDTVPSVLNRPGVNQRPVQTGNIKFIDNFDKDTLAPSWVSMWGPADDYIHVGDKGVVLDYAPVKSGAGKTPAYIGQRVKNHDFTVTITLTVPRDASENDAAGILIVKSEKRQIFFAVTPNRVSVLKPSGEVVASSPVHAAGHPVQLRVRCEGGKYSFAYSENAASAGKNNSGSTASEQWHEMDGTVDASYVSSSQGGFTGTTIGIFATSEPF